jgi:hypothetical protein
VVRIRKNSCLDLSSRCPFQAFGEAEYTPPLSGAVPAPMARAASTQTSIVTAGNMAVFFSLHYHPYISTTISRNSTARLLFAPQDLHEDTHHKIHIRHGFEAH